MYVGPIVNGLQHSNALRRIFSEVRCLPVATARAATMFCLNLHYWKEHQFIRTHYPATRIAHLDDELQELAHTSADDVDIEWGMRQLVWQRV